MAANRGWTELVLAGAIVAMGTTFVACGHRKHLTRTHGRATEEVMRVQTANPDAGNNSQPGLGLDSQEAAIVAAGYQKSLGGEGTAASSKDSQILLIKDEQPKSR